MANPSRVADDLVPAQSIATCNTITKLLETYEHEIGNTRGHLRVPSNVVRSVKQILPEYQFILNHTVRRNIAYAVEALDFHRWLINRFGIYGPVLGYEFKVGLVLIDMILEAMVRDFIERKGKKAAKKHSQNIKKLASLSVPQKMVDAVDNLHTRRSNIHLHLVSDLEATKYTLKDWNKAILCLHAAKKALSP